LRTISTVTLGVGLANRACVLRANKYAPDTPKSLTQSYLGPPGP
jgi:hypothetical protein